MCANTTSLNKAPRQAVSRLLFVLGSVSLLALSGCASLNGRLAPEPEPVVTTDVVETPPGDWVEYAPEALPSTLWVQDFNDPILFALVDEALRENNTIGAAYARLDAARARRGIAGADRLPSVSANGGLSRSENANDFIPDSTSISAGLSASWEPDFWGRVADGIQAADLDVEATQYDIASARLSIAGQVSQLWFDVIEARLLSELSIRDVETQERALRLTQRRFEGGVAGSSDVRLARTSLANSQALQASRLQNQSVLTRRLEVLLARYPADALDAAANLPVLPTLSGAGAPIMMLSQRPDLIAIEARLAGQGLQIDLARKALLPRLSLTGSTSLAGGGLESFFDLDALASRLAANLTAPIFQGGRLKANVEQQRALLRVQLEQYASAVLDAYLDVENALDAETRLTERETALQTAVVEAQQAENRLELRYSEGLATILQLLDAQSRRLSAEGQLITARGERLANRVRLHVALGGGAYGDIPPDAQPVISTTEG